MIPKHYPVNATLEVPVTEILAATTDFTTTEMGILFLLLLHKQRLGFVPSSNVKLQSLARIAEDDEFATSWDEIAPLLGVKP